VWREKEGHKSRFTVVAYNRNKGSGGEGGGGNAVFFLKGDTAISDR
jgi:hypothetical protein